MTQKYIVHAMYTSYFLRRAVHRDCVVRVVKLQMERLSLWPSYAILQLNFTFSEFISYSAINSENLNFASSELQRCDKLWGEITNFLLFGGDFLKLKQARWVWVGLNYQPKVVRIKLKDAHSFQVKHCIPFLLSPMRFSNNPYRYREVASEKLRSVQKGSSLQAQGVRKVLANWKS